MSKSDKSLEAAMRSHRPRHVVENEVASTIFGKLAAESKEAVMLPVSQIRSSPFQSRTHLATPEDEEYMENLMATIAEDSLLNPILVRVLDSNTPGGTGSGGDKVLESNTAQVTPLPGTVLESNTAIYELIAGHNRLEAMKRLGRDKVPAVIRRMNDVEAARALTIDNLVRKGLSDWELYRHIAMLHSVNAVKSQKDLAKMLGCSRAKVMMLECFGKLPQAAMSLLDQQPALLGASQVYDLEKAGYLQNHPDEVIEAIEKVAERKIKQSGILGYIQRKVERPLVPYRKEVAIRDTNRTVKLVVTRDEAKITGDIDFDKLHALIEANLHALGKDDTA